LLHLERVGESEKLTNIVAVNFTKREMLAKREHRREQREMHRVLKREREITAKNLEEQWPIDQKKNV